MRRLEHLSGVERVRVGIVVVQTQGCLAEDCRGVFVERLRLTGRQAGETGVELRLRFAKT
jgi:hypothetical protein